jgi:hypothetical protein
MPGQFNNANGNIQFQAAILFFPIGMRSFRRLCYCRSIAIGWRYRYNDVDVGGVRPPAAGGVAWGLTAMEPPKKRGPRPKGEAGRVRVTTTMIRSSPEWRRAVEELAEADRAVSLAELFDRAIVSYARQIGHKKPIPRR